MGDARKWIIQMLSSDVTCNDLKEIAKGIAQDQTLADGYKAVLRNLWKAKYNICKINERSVINERSNS